MGVGEKNSKLAVSGVSGVTEPPTEHVGYPPNGSKENHHSRDCSGVVIFSFSLPVIIIVVVVVILVVVDSQSRCR